MKCKKQKKYATVMKREKYEDLQEHVTDALRKKKGLWDETAREWS
jgi:hypothetical protein